MGMLDRKVQIMQEIRERGRVNVSRLAEQYHVSTMTIRRDLARLEQDGLVTVEYGGAILKQPSMLETDMKQKHTECMEEKKRIAKAAAAFIHDGDSVFLDAGTTVCEAARLLNQKKELQIMTNSLLAANALSVNSTNKLVMCPGEYRALSMAFIGQLTDEFLTAFRFDVLLLGVEGVTEDGIYVPDEKDGITKKQLIRQSDMVICVADHSKIGQRFHYRIVGLESVNHLITDSAVLSAQLGRLREKTDVILA